MLIHLKVFGYMFRPHCGHLQANIYRLSCLQYAYNIGSHSVCSTKMYHILSVDIHFNSGYITHITIVHTMGSHIVRTLKALNMYMLAWRWPQCGRNMQPKTSKCISAYNCVFYYIIVVSHVKYIHLQRYLPIQHCMLKNPWWWSLRDRNT